MKKILLILMLLLISGCGYSKIENELDFGSITVEKGDEWLESYAKLRYEKDYDFGFSFNDSDVSTHPFEHEFYIWDKTLCNELRETLIEIVEKLDELEDTYYHFHVSFADDFIIKNGKSELIKLEKHLHTAIIATLLPEEFISNSEAFKYGLMMMIISLESGNQTGLTDVVSIRVRLKNNMELLYNPKNYEKNTLYGFNNLEELSKFYSSTYEEKLENVNTGGNHIIDLDNDFVDSISKGQYLWIQFTAPADGKYSFKTEGSKINTKIEAYSQFKGNVIIAGNTDILSKAKITISLTEQQVIFLKLWGSSLEDYGIVVLQAKLIE